MAGNYTVGHVFPELQKVPITREQLVRFAGASGDFNPLHYDDSVGKKAGTGGAIAHGMLVMGMVGETVTRWIPRRALKKLSVRFKGITFPGDAITVTGKIVSKCETEHGTLIKCEVAAADQKGNIKVAGYFEAVLT